MTIRIACTALSKRIKAGHPTKDGHRFKGGGADVTNECLMAVIQFVEPENTVTVSQNGKPAYEITVRKL